MGHLAQEIGLFLFEADMENLFCVGDLIEFDFFGLIKKGHIVQVGKHGYWIDYTSGGVGSGSVRCPFDKAIRLAS